MKNFLRGMMPDFISVSIFIIGAMVVLGAVAANRLMDDDASSVPDGQPVVIDQRSALVSGGGFDPGTGTYGPLKIDASRCSEGYAGISFGFGSTRFAVEGENEGVCVFWHGTEIENPEWDGTLDNYCRVPTNVSVDLTVTNGGILFEPISQFCGLVR